MKQGLKTLGNLPSPPEEASAQMFVFLMTDVVGSTGLWEANRDAMSRHVGDLDELVSRVVDSNEGRLVKPRGEGDSHFCVFGSVDSALIAAVQIQLSLAEDVRLKPIRLRVALHAGDADDRAQDFYGPVVNRCARLRETAHPSQILASEVIQLLAHPEVGITFKPLGLHRLRDLMRPERVFQVVSPGLKDEFPPPRSLSACPQNLPVQLTSFIGRAAEIRAVSDLVRSDRLTTVTGAGGAGKTRLALQVAVEHAERFDEGVWFVDLGQTSRPETVVPILCSVVAPGSEASLDKLVAAIDQHRMLLILDNCEHLHQECRDLARTLLLQCPNLRLLATSRKDLGAPGEHVYRLGGLSIPPADRTQDGLEYDAIHLFGERANWRGAGIELNEKSLAAIADLCRRLDGLPLAIEIAAGATDVLSISDIGRSISEFLDRAIPDSLAQPRHATMVATIEWSLKLLSPAARELMQRLTIFPHTWTLEGASHVCGYGAVPAKKITESMRELLSHSLVFTDRSGTDQVRFGMLQTTRQVLTLEFRESAPLRKRYVAFYRELIEQGAGPGGVVPEKESYDLVEAEYENLLKALDLAFDLLPSECSTIAQAMRSYWIRSTHLRDGKVWFERLSVAPRLESKERLAALNALSAMCINSGDYERARRVLVPAELELRASGGYEWAKVVGNLAVLWSNTNRLADSKQGFANCIPLFRELGYWEDEALALLNLGIVSMRLGDLDREYIPHFVEARERAEAHGSVTIQANAHSCLAEAAKRQHDYPAAIEHCCRALELWQEGPYIRATASGFVNLCELTVLLEEFQVATSMWHAAERLEELSEAPFTERQRIIMDSLKSQLKNKISSSDWRAAQRLVRGKSAPELISMALNALQERPAS